MKPATFSDETLMAYADGELPAAEAAAVRAAAIADPAVAARIELFASSRRLLRESHDPLLLTAVPASLRETVSALGRRPRATRRRQIFSRALAASLLLAVAGATGWSFIGRGGSDLGAGMAQLPAAIVASLERLPSGGAAEIAVGARQMNMLVLASYDHGGGWCREFELDAGTADEAVQRGLACRDGDRWRLRAFADLAVAPPDASAYLPASGSTDLAPMFGLRAPLSAAEERQRLDRERRR